MLQQLWLRLQLFVIEAGHCLGQIFGTNFGQIVVVEPLAGIQGCSRYCRQCYEARAGPGELKSSPGQVIILGRLQGKSYLDASRDAPGTADNAVKSGQG